MRRGWGGGPRRVASRGSPAPGLGGCGRGKREGVSQRLGASRPSPRPSPAPPGLAAPPAAPARCRPRGAAAAEQGAPSVLSPPPVPPYALAAPLSHAAHRAHSAVHFALQRFIVFSRFCLFVSLRSEK